ncbi:MAG: hypothetical protein IT353_07985 [Gemmatimonadaceae bacterium]|nr:hypothetical protein [Gemmatimonadaceae bacterium]
MSETAPELTDGDGNAPTWWDRAVRTGSLATIATGGALIGLGMRQGEASRVFRLAGRGILERTGVASTTAPLTSVAVGYIHHLAVATLWGVVLSAVVLPLRGVTRVVMAVILVALYTWVSVEYVPAGLRIGYTVTANLPSAVPIGVSLVVALLGGIWLAATDTSA